MKQSFILFIRNVRDGFHHNSSYWQQIRETCLCYLLIYRNGYRYDAGLTWTSKDAHMKIEQSCKQLEFVDPLFKEYCFAITSYI